MYVEHSWAYKSLGQAWSTCYVAVLKVNRVRGRLLKAVQRVFCEDSWACVRMGVDVTE